MTATTTKSGQKRLDSCALHTRRWAKIAENPRKNTCTLHETATPVDAANAELENYGKIRQLHHKTKILGKYRRKFAESLLKSQVISSYSGLDLEIFQQNWHSAP